jgi:hypothetical protein
MPEADEIDTLLPVHLQPKDDELLSSWIVRIAIAHALKPDTFYSLLLSGRSKFPIYIDETENWVTLSKLQMATRVPRYRIEATTLQPYVNNLSSYFPAGHDKPRSMAYQWVMPISHQGLSYNLYGLQFCPSCLSEDKAPYFRHKWRFAFLTLCGIHRSLLLDRCTRCGMPIDFRRNASVVSKNRQHMAQSMTRCHSCGFDIRAAKSPQVSRSTLSDDLEFQNALLNALVVDDIEDPKGKLHISSSLFYTLYELATLLSFGGFGKFIRIQLCRRYGFRIFTVVQPEIYKCIEVLNVRERYNILRLVGSVLGEWPNDLLSFSWRNRAQSPNMPPIIKDVGLFSPLDGET